MSKLALLGGTPVCDGPPKSPWPFHDDRERALLAEALEARGWGGFPEPMPLADRFAGEFAARHDAAHGVCAVNGSVTLEVALGALGIEAGDEIIVPTYTWVATGACAIHVNAVPVFVDVDPGTYCMDPAAVEAAITPRTRGIIPVHLGSTIADLDALLAICRKHDLFCIEDCAHMHGAKWRGKGVGSWGDIGSFSFQTTKLMTAGEGGALITSDDELIQRCHAIINCGRKEPGYDAFEGGVLGINGRITELQAAVLLAQLERLDAAAAARAEGAAWLAEQLAPLGLVALDVDPRITERGCYQLIFKYQRERFADLPRETVLAALAAEGVGLDGDFYVPMHHNPIFDARSAQWPQLRERYGDGLRTPENLEGLQFPVAAKAAYEEAVWMHHPHLSAAPADRQRLVEAVAKVQRHAADLR